MEDAKSTDIKNNDSLLKYSLDTEKARYSVLPDVFFSPKHYFKFEII